MNVWVLHLPQPLPESEALKRLATLPLPLDAREDYTQCTSEYAVRKKLSALSPDAPPETINREAERIWNMLCSLHAEDIIAVPLQAQGTVHYAQICGHVRHSGAALEVPVTWYARDSRILSFHRFRDLFLPGTGSGLIEVRDPRARAAVRDKLPLPGNRFRRIKWIIILVLAIKFTVIGVQLWRQETAGF